MTECVFCKVAAGEFGTTFVYEDDLVVAFDDLAPQAPVHTLIVPREHVVNLGDDVPAVTLAALLAAVPKVAAAKGIDMTGYRVIVNNGLDANQSVMHLHLHVLGGRRLSHGMVVFAGEV